VVRHLEMTERCASLTGQACIRLAAVIKINCWQ
jgi:hypothetical protein